MGLGSYLRIVRTSRSASPLEYASDEDAEGDVATDGSYVTPITSSPVRPEVSIVGDAMEAGEPTEDRLDEVRTLVPIEEVEEVVPDSITKTEITFKHFQVIESRQVAKRSCPFATPFK